ncbi:MAG: hypothetical protein U9R25_14035 [Chloroflexota bacterium]|nr:hypothetical protein [Chloroflexota bacterium]
MNNPNSSRDAPDGNQDYGQNWSASPPRAESALDSDENVQKMGGFVLGLGFLLIILSYACAAAVVIGLLWFVFTRVVLP